ncbi:MAG TPA: glycosyltransferase family 9 protein [Candidatus Acidoferrales bacterium]|nr:glycosyltransferase family 9 protein [Candidatus Acidoferrales bacterium]
MHHLRDDLRGLLKLWTQIAGKSDLIVCTPEMSAAKLIILKILTGADNVIGEASAPYSWLLTHSVVQSWTDSFLEAENKIASFLGIATPLESPKIHLRAEEVAWAEMELSREGLGDRRPLVGVQSSSVVSSKRWPAQNFGELVCFLAKQYPELAVISFGAESERTVAERARTFAGNVIWYEATGRWTIRETLAMLSVCDLFISGDTGLMHMAAAVQTRTVGIFGPTSTSRRAPLHNGGIAVKPDTPCHPCFRGKWTPCDCIRSITPDQVALVAEQCLQSCAPVPQAS